MPPIKPLRTTLSTKGQVILPKAIRDQRHWTTGTRLEVRNTDEGVLLTAAPSGFEPSEPREVFGILTHPGPAKTLEEMDMAIAAEFRRRHAGD